MFRVLRASRRLLLRPAVAVAVLGGAALPLMSKRTELASMPILETPPAPAPQGMADYRTIYDYNVEDTNGKIVSLKDFEKYRVILVVNTASSCMSADRNYKQLQELYDKYKDQGFTVLAFPCDQFLGQEPLKNEDIPKHAKEMGVTFPMFGKVRVNGKDASELFEWLKMKTPGMFTNAVKWNFQKFLVVDGVPRARYAPADAPRLLEDDIAQALLDVNSPVMDSLTTKVDKKDINMPNRDAYRKALDKTEQPSSK